MLVITDAAVVLRDRILRGGTIVVDGERIAAVHGQTQVSPGHAVRLDACGGLVLPGFVDVHVHGVLGHDVLDGGEALAWIARALPQFGVTTFCPTTVACRPEALHDVLAGVRAHREHPSDGSARMHGAHLESNFINPEMKGAQPEEYLCAAPGEGASGARVSGEEILAAIAAHRPEVAIVTLAPEIPGGLELLCRLVDMGIMVSLGHSAADFTLANQAFDAGARHTTHLFNRMLPLGHREPGLAGAALSRDEVTAEVICDGYHVHPSMVRFAIASKGAAGIVAISDGTAGAGLASGSCARLGGQRLTVGDEAAYLDDGTLAGSTLTMDGAFRMLVHRAGQSVVDAAAMCTSSPARALRLDDRGVIAPGMLADLVVLDTEHRVVHTCVAGRIVYTRERAKASR